MNMTAIIAAALTAAVISVVLKQYKPEYSMLVSMGAGILILAAIAEALKPVLDLTGQLSQQAGVQELYTEVLLKALAVCYITSLARDCCTDAGESAIGAKVEMAGKTAVLIISLPLFQGIIETVTGLISP